MQNTQRTMITIRMIAFCSCYTRVSNIALPIVLGRKRAILTDGLQSCIHFIFEILLEIIWT